MLFSCLVFLCSHIFIAPVIRPFLKHSVCVFFCSFIYFYTCSFLVVTSTSFTFNVLFLFCFKPKRKTLQQTLRNFSSRLQSIWKNQHPPATKFSFAIFIFAFCCILYFCIIFCRTHASVCRQF